MAPKRSWPKGFDPENAACPKCSGEMYDNRFDAKRKKGMPMFRCKDKECTDDSDRVTGVWGPEPEGEKGGGGGGAAPAREVSAPTPKYNFTPIEKAALRKGRVADYLALMQTVKDGMVKIALGDAEAMIALDMANVQAATFSIWGDLKACGALRDPAMIVSVARKKGELGPIPTKVEGSGSARPPAKAKGGAPESTREAAADTAKRGAVPPSDRPAKAAGRPALIDTRDESERAGDTFDANEMEPADDDLPF